MTQRTFLNEDHWSELVGAVFKEVQRQQTPKHSPLGQLWRLLLQANQHKRFSIEVENADALLGARTNDNETFERLGWLRPRHRNDGAG